MFGFLFRPPLVRLRPSGLVLTTWFFDRDSSVPIMITVVMQLIHLQIWEARQNAKKCLNRRIAVHRGEVGACRHDTNNARLPTC